MSTSAVAPAPRVAPNLPRAFGGIWRLTFRQHLSPSHWLTLAIGLAVLTLLFASGPRGGGPARFFDWTINFYLTFLVPALAFMAGGGAMRDEMKSGTVDYVLTRPVPRPAFVVFKFIAHLLCTQLDFLVAFAVVLVFARAHDVHGFALIATKLLLVQMLLVVAFGALGFLCGAIAARYVVIGLVYAGVIEAGLGQIPTQLSQLSMTHQARELLRPLWDGGAVAAAAPGWFATMAVLLAFGVVALTAAAAIFTLRELSGVAET